MTHITFRRPEYEEIDEGVRIMVKTIVEKLPTPQRRKFRQLPYEEENARTQAELVRDGIDVALLAEWINRNLSLTKAGRQPSAIYTLLVEVRKMSRAAGMGRVNAALEKNLNTNNPGTCTPQYLRAILRNDLQSVQASSRPVKPHPATPFVPPATPDDAWQHILLQVRQRISADNYRTWIAPLSLKLLNQQTFQIWCPDDIYGHWLEEHYARVLAEAYASIYGHAPADLQFCGNEEEEESS